MSSDSEFEEIKINTVREELEKKQRNLVNLEKKKEKKKVKAKKNLLEKYKEQIDDNFQINNPSIQLVKTQKRVNEVKKPSRISEIKKVYVKDDFILSVAKDQKFLKKTKEDVKNFRKQHFFGSRLKRENIGKILSKR